MLQATIRELPSRQLLCATERGAINNDMSATAQRAFARLFPAAQTLGLMPRMTGCLAVCPDEMTSPNDPDMRFIAALSRHVGPYNTLWQTWRAIYGD